MERHFVALDSQLAAIARRVAERRGHRASEIYKAAADMRRAVPEARLETIETLLAQIADFAPEGWGFEETAKFLAEYNLKGGRG
jgi:hypothetical protein